MTTSDSINELAAALAKAQAEMGAARKDSTNPHFKSSYADLASVRDACVPALTKHGIAVIQSPRLVMNGTALLELETRFLHASGQWAADTLVVPLSKVDAQGVGSATTYARRYALAAFACIAQADDDGEAAIGRTSSPMAKVQPVAPEGFAAWLDELAATSALGTSILRAKWEASPAHYRAHLTATNKAEWERLKDAAALAVEQAKVSA